MKKGFTLVELLVVVVVIVTLLGVTFRLAGVGSDSTARNVTVNRLQRLENCLSGYYAAYGSYPPVKLHGKRDYTLDVDSHGVQRSQKNERPIKASWSSIEAACKSQPIGMTYPFNRSSAKAFVSELSSMLQNAPENAGNPLYHFEALIDNSTISSKEDKTDWQDCQIFRFGLLSYLLPRYLIIMGGDDDVNNDEIFARQMSWKSNNQIPPQFESGVPYPKWEDVNDEVKHNPWKIAALPSQATCARWIPNLEKQLSTLQSEVVYGVELRDPDAEGTTPLFIYSAGNSEQNSQQYFPDRITILDGWQNEFYYYSLPPHQGYRLWSAGKNGKTFPPWVDDNELKSLSADDRKTVQDWIGDDIVQMSN